MKIGVSGVRGVVGESLTPELVADFAASFGTYIGSGVVLVGRDTRPSGSMIEKAVVAGLISVGCRPMLLGVVPTPTIQINVPKLNARGAVAITASHNPEEWNALKLIGPSGILLNANETTELLDIYNQPDSDFTAEDEYCRPKRLKDAFSPHSNRIFDVVEVDLIRKRHFKVAMDSCDGAGSEFAAPFLESLGCEVVPLFNSTAGGFRRPPEPIPANLAELSAAVRSNGCDIGFAQDPDADRLVIVDGTGKPVGEQYSVVLAAEHVLSRNSGPIVVNIGTTRAANDVAVKYDCPLIFSKVGEINVIDAMRIENAVIGGEGGSGGVIYPEIHPCRDSFAGMALILEMMAERKLSVEDILSALPSYCAVNRKVPCSAENARRVIRGIVKRHGEADLKTIDGLRIDWEDRWVLLRPSNTEPIIRVTAEALSDIAAAELADEFVAEIASFG